MRMVSVADVWKRLRATQRPPSSSAARTAKLRMNSGRCRMLLSSRASVTRASARRRCSSDWCRLWVSSRATATCAARARARRTSSSLMGPGSMRSSTPNIPSTSPFEPSRGTARSWRIWKAATKSKSAPGVLAASSVKNTFFFFSVSVAGPSESGISTGADDAVLHCPSECGRSPFLREAR